MLVKVGAPSETRVQDAAEKDPVPTPLRVKSTEPEGSDLVPVGVVSVTVAVHVPSLTESQRSRTVDHRRSGPLSIECDGQSGVAAQNSRTRVCRAHTSRTAQVGRATPSHKG